MHFIRSFLSNNSLICCLRCSNCFSCLLACLSNLILFVCVYVCVSIRKHIDYMKLVMNENRSVNTCEHLVSFFFSVYNVCSADDRLKISNKGFLFVSIPKPSIAVYASRFWVVSGLAEFRGSIIEKFLSLIIEVAGRSILSVSNIQKKIAKFLFNFVLNDADCCNRTMKLPEADWCSFARANELRIYEKMSVHLHWKTV